MRLINELRDRVRQQRRLAEQRRELSRMREELAEHRERNQKTLEGMRRCMSCDYRTAALELRAEQKPDA